MGDVAFFADDKIIFEFAAFAHRLSPYATGCGVNFGLTEFGHVFGRFTQKILWAQNGFAFAHRGFGIFQGKLPKAWVA